MKKILPALWMFVVLPGCDLGPGILPGISPLADTEGSDQSPLVSCTDDLVCQLRNTQSEEALVATWGVRMHDFWAVGPAGYAFHQTDNGRWAAKPVPSTGRLQAIWGAATNDVWAGGTDILHWDGRSWTRAVADVGPIRDIWGTSADSVWAAGQHGIWRWNGVTWRRMPSGTSRALHGVWATGPRNVWAVGAGGALQHWNGERWTDHSIALAAGQAFTDVWGASASDVWVVGTGLSFAMRWNGVRWNKVAIDFSATRIWGHGANDAYIAGGRAIAHWNGRAWSVFSTATTSNFNGVFGCTLNGQRFIWTVGAGGRSAWFNWGGTWRDVSIGFRRDFVDVHPFSPTEAFVATIQYDVLRWNGSRLLPANNTLHNGPLVVGGTAGDVWVGTYSGHVMHWEAGRWTTTYLGIDVGITDIWASSPSDVWLVGERHPYPEAYIFRWNGSAWSQMPNSLGVGLRAISGTGPNDVWVAGGDPNDQTVLAHWNGIEWEVVPDAPAIHSLSARAPNDVWGVGYLPFDTVRVGHFDSFVWRWDYPAPFASGAPSHILASASGVHVTGPSGQLARWDHDHWTPIDTGVAANLSALSAIGDAVWITGAAGTLLRMSP